MTRLSLRAALAVTACALVLAFAGGCVLGTRAQSTRVTITVPGNRLLFMALIPRLLPDGTLSTEKRDALLEKVAEKAVGKPLLQLQRAAWAPGADKVPTQEAADVLWVVGTPELGQLIYESLRDDFDQKIPFLLPIPLQTQMPPSRRQPSETAPDAGPADAGGTPAGEGP